MSGLVAETFYLPVFSIVTVLISYFAVSIVLTKLSNTGVLNVSDHGNWINIVSASERTGYFADTTLANKIVMVNLNQYTSGWELGFPFSLFDPSLVTEGTSLTIYNSPSSSVGSTVRVTYANVTPGVAPGSDQELCSTDGSTSCACPDVQAFCDQCDSTDCTKCKCSQVCNPRVNLHLNVTLGRGQGVTVVVQRRIPNNNLSQTGTCFYIDLTPSELQPRDWMPVMYHAPDQTDAYHGDQILVCSNYNNYATRAPPQPDPTMVALIRQGLPNDAGPADAGNGDRNKNLCFGYTVGDNTTFSDNVPSGFFSHAFRQNGPHPTYASQADAVPLYNTQWQDCMAANCNCIGNQLGVWCETP